MVENMVLMEGVQRVVRVRLENEAGEILAPDGFLVYGGAFCPGQRRARFDAVREADGYVLTVPGLSEGTVPWSYQVFVAEYATGVEWLMCEGEIEVLSRYAGCGRGVDSGELELVGRVDRVQQEMVVRLGDSAASVALNAARAVSAREGAEAAAKQADAAATNATNQATSATTARTKAEEAQQGSEKAQQASEKASQDAAQAQVSARNAKTEAETAKVKAQTAEGNAKSYADSAAAAKTAAEKAAQDAARAQAGAEQAKTDAESAKVEAQTAEGNAKASANAAAADKIAAEKAKQDALAAKTKAEQEAVKAEQNAALLGDAALKSGDNVFSGANVFNGALSGNGTLFGMQFQRWLGIGFCMRGIRWSWETMTALIPPSKELKVLPPIDCSSMAQWVNAISDKKINDNYPNIEYIFAYQLAADQVDYSPGFPLIHVYKKLKEYWFYCELTNHWFAYFTQCQAPNSYYFLPKWTGKNLCIRSGSARNAHTRIYAPLAEGVKLGNEQYSTDRFYNIFTFLGDNVVKTLELGTGHSISIELVNGHFPHCVNLKIDSACYVERGTLLTLLDSLPAYDAASMTTQPTASLYIDPDLQGDTDVEAALFNLQTAVEDGGKGWTVAVTGITLGGAATFGLRQTYYYARREDADGAYIDADGQRWDISGGTTVLRNYEANEEVAGYSAFLSLDDALAEWGLHEITPEESKADYERRYGAAE